MGGGSSVPTGSDAFPWYVNESHQWLLGTSRNWTNAVLTRTYGKNPYSQGLDREASYNPNVPIEYINPKESFFGSGNTISTYTSVFEMFEDYVVNIDLTTLWNDIMSDTISGSAITDDIAAEADLLNSEVDSVSIPKINAGMRDLNAVMSSSFIYNKTLIESEKVKAIAKYSSQVKFRAMELALQRYQTDLKWNMSTVELNNQLWKFYWLAYFDWTATQADYYKNHATWQLQVLDHLRAHLSATRAGLPSPGAQGPSTAQKALSGALAGASTGFAVSGGNPVGAAIGGVVGLVGGLLT